MGSMNPPAPQPMSDMPPSTQEIIDREHLKLLSIAHYIYGGLHAFLSCLLIFHFGLGLVMAIAPQVFGNGNGQAPPPVWIGLMMSGFTGCLMLLGWLFGGLTIYSGICIKQRKH